MTDSEIMALVNEAVVQALPERADDVASMSINAKLADVGIESIAALEIAAFLEERLGKQFPDDELACITDLHAFAELVHKYA
jgi:acyl carrier protein